jgi:hypothetical protein
MSALTAERCEELAERHETITMMAVASTRPIDTDRADLARDTARALRNLAAGIRYAERHDYNEGCAALLPILTTGEQP